MGGLGFCGGWDPTRPYSCSDLLGSQVAGQSEKGSLRGRRDMSKRTEIPISFDTLERLKPSQEKLFPLTGMTTPSSLLD